MTTPFNNLKCIWMSSGFINYKICDKNFDCDNCELYHSIKEKGVFYDTKKNSDELNITDQKDTTVTNISYELPKNYLISNNHIWFNPISDNEAYIGLDYFAVLLLNKFKMIQYHKMNLEIYHDKPMIWFINSKGAISIFSPLSAKVLAINKELEKDISILFNNNPYKIWLMKIRFNNKKDISNNFINSDFDDFILEEKEIVKNYYLKLNSTAAVGETFFDGGDLINNIYDIFPENTYFKMCQLIFNKKNWSHNESTN